MIASVGATTASLAQFRAGVNALQGQGLSQEEQKQVQELKKRDAEVRAHEQAHMSAGAGVVQGGATYQFVRGPDGRSYAVGGEVSIDVSEGNTPQETIRKAQQIRAAALAPQDPSAQDRAVAARATQMESQARIKLAADKDESGPAGSTPDRQAAGSGDGQGFAVRQALQGYTAQEPSRNALFSTTA